MLLPEELTPYNFSFYKSRLEGASELQEIFLEVTILYSKHCMQLIHRSEAFIILYEQLKNLTENVGKSNKPKDQKNVINGQITCISTALDDEPKVKNCNHKAVNIEFDQIVSAFITSNALCFTILENKGVYICLSRIEEDICHMYTLFSTKNEEQDYYLAIIKNPKNLTNKFIACEKQENEEENVNRKDNNSNNLNTDSSNVNHHDFSKNDEIHNEIDEKENTKIIDTEYASNIANKTETKNEIQKDYEILNRKTKNVKEDEIKKYIANLEEKKNKAYEKTKLRLEKEAKQKMKKNEKKDDESDNIEMKSIEQDRIDKNDNVENNNSYHIKLGKITNNTMSYDKDTIEDILTIENLKHLKNYVMLLVIKMIQNGYDYIEVRSEIDFTILKDKDDFTFLFFDQVCRNNIQAITKFNEIKENIVKLLADLKKLQK